MGGICVLEFSSLTAGYAKINELLSEPGLVPLEVSPIAPGRLVTVLEAEDAILERVARNIRDTAELEIHDFQLIRNIHATLLSGLYGFLKRQAGESLLFLEAGSLSAALFGANQVLQSTGLDLIEIRHPRGLGGKALASFTGSAKDISAAERQLVVLFRARTKDIKIKSVMEISAGFRPFFNLGGEK